MTCNPKLLLCLPNTSSTHTLTHTHTLTLNHSHTHTLTHTHTHTHTLLPHTPHFAPSNRSWVLRMACGHRFPCCCTHLQHMATSMWSRRWQRQREAVAGASTLQREQTSRHWQRKRQRQRERAKTRASSPSWTHVLVPWRTASSRLVVLP